MAVSIRDLLDQTPPQQVPKAKQQPTEAERRRVPPQVQPAADSIFSALGIPARVIEHKWYPSDIYGSFNVLNGQITMYRMFEHEYPGTLAHELTHQATTRRNMAPEVESFVNLFLNKFSELPALKKQHHYDRLASRGYVPTPEEVYASDQGKRDSIVDFPSLMRYIEKPGRQGAEMQEVIAHVMRDGYELARLASPRDTGEVRESTRRAVAEAEQRYPGTREAFNFFMRAFQSLPPDGK